MFSKNIDSDSDSGREGRSLTENDNYYGTGINMFISSMERISVAKANQNQSETTQNISLPDFKKTLKACFKLQDSDEWNSAKCVSRAVKVT